jgi:hypothetical protein
LRREQREERGLKGKGGRRTGKGEVIWRRSKNGKGVGGWNETRTAGGKGGEVREVGGSVLGARWK